jgi:hypothetical protein
MQSRKERLEYAEAMLDAVLEKYKEIPIQSFVFLMMDTKHLGVTRQTAEGYWEVLRKNQKFDHDGIRIKKHKAINTTTA